MIKRDPAPGSHAIAAQARFDGASIGNPKDRLGDAVKWSRILRLPVNPRLGLNANSLRLLPCLWLNPTPRPTNPLMWIRPVQRLFTSCRRRLVRYDVHPPGRLGARLGWICRGDGGEARLGWAREVDGDMYHLGRPGDPCHDWTQASLGEGRRSEGRRVWRRGAGVICLSRGLLGKRPQEWQIRDFQAMLYAKRGVPRARRLT